MNESQYYVTEVIMVENTYGYVRK